MPTKMECCSMNYYEEKNCAKATKKINEILKETNEQFYKTQDKSMDPIESYNYLSKKK